MTMCLHCEPLIKAIDAYLAKADSKLAEALKKAGFIKPKETVKAISILEDYIAEELESEREYYRRKAEESEDLESFCDNRREIAAGDDTDARLEKIFKETFSVLLLALAAAYIKSADKELSAAAMTERTIKRADDWSRRLGEIMKLDTQNEVEKLADDMLANGKDIDDLIQSLTDGGLRSGRGRAMTAAVTETLRAHSMAQQEAFVQNPSIETKVWVHAGSFTGNPRENHVRMHGVKAPKNEPFTLRGADGFLYYPMYPRDESLPAAESCNCQCIQRGIVNKDIYNLSAEEKKRLQREAINKDNEAFKKESGAQDEPS